MPVLLPSRIVPAKTLAPSQASICDSDALLLPETGGPCSSPFLDLPGIALLLVVMVTARLDIQFAFLLSFF